MKGFFNSKGVTVILGFFVLKFLWIYRKGMTPGVFLRVPILNRGCLHSS